MGERRILRARGGGRTGRGGNVRARRSAGPSPAPGRPRGERFKYELNQSLGTNSRRGEAAQQTARSSERDVVVEFLAAATAGLFREGRRRRRAAAGSAAARLPACARGSAAPAAPAAAEHLQLVADDLGRVAVIALLVLPLAGAQAPLDVHLRAFFQVLAGNLGQAAKERDT